MVMNRSVKLEPAPFNLLDFEYGISCENTTNDQKRRANKNCWTALNGPKVRVCFSAHYNYDTKTQ